MMYDKSWKRILFMAFTALSLSLLIVYGLRLFSDSGQSMKVSAGELTPTYICEGRIIDKGIYGGLHYGYIMVMYYDPIVEHDRARTFDVMDYNRWLTYKEGGKVKVLIYQTNGFNITYALE